MANDAVQIDQDNMVKIQQGFASEAQQVRSMLQNINGRMDPLVRGDWIGEAARAFYAEMNDFVLPSVRNLADALEDGAATVGKTTKSFQDADTEMKSIMLRRIHA